MHFLQLAGSAGCYYHVTQMTGLVRVIEPVGSGNLQTCDFYDHSKLHPLPPQGLRRPPKYLFTHKATRVWETQSSGRIKRATNVFKTVHVPLSQHKQGLVNVIPINFATGTR